VGGDLRGGGGVAFGSVARIAGQWFSDDGVAFTAKVPAGSGVFVWRAATYDTFSLAGWEQSTVRGVAVAAGDPLVADTAEDPVPALTTQVQFTVTPQGYHDTKLLTPGVPTALDIPATVLLAGDDGWYVGTDVSGDATYTVQASVLRISETNGITGNQLRAASQDYPAEVASRYTGVPAGAVGPDAADLLQAILARSPSRNPYDLAVTMQDYLRSSRFTYTTDVRGTKCTDPSAVECFARTRQGYCQHYASTMAILLRAADPQHPIPTRFVQGFLPGTRVGTTETVLNRAAHAWVEVYFPGYGWIPFDPTGSVGRPTQIQDGPPVASSSPAARPAASGGDVPRASRRPINDVPGQGGGGGTIARPADRTIFGLLAGALALLVLFMVAVAWWRGPRGEVTPESAWSSLARAASRFGFAPRPTQTIYEYATSLGDLVPVARPDLRTVADAKVETTYAQTELTPARIMAVRDAMRRLRLSMVRLVVRRVWRRRPRR
jgi:transglutaminase-like putative cysteine protease